MDRLRETLNPEEQGVVLKPTKHKTATNQYAVPCRQCGDIYYVDEQVHRRVLAAAEADPTENPFCCERCEEEYAEEAHAR